MKFVKIIFAAILLLPGVLFSQNRTITVKGNVKFDFPQAKMEIYRYDGPEKIVIAQFDIDENNNYDYKMEVKEPGLYYLDCKKWERIAFWAEDEDIKVNFRGMDTAKIKIKNPPFHLIEGGPKNEVINHYNYLGYQNYQQMIAISQLCYKAKFVSDSERDSVSMVFYGILENDMKSRVKFLIDQYSDRTSVVSLLSYLDLEKDAELIKRVETKLLDKHPGYAPLVKHLKERRERAELEKRVAVGAIAPDFEYSTPDGKLLGPASFRGKILLIDFWASWCGPCRQEIPNLKKAYEMYKDRGVEFLSVSVDGDQKAWTKAMEQEGMSWPQILATKSGKEVMRQYQFSGIPFIILLDREGKIMYKHLRGEKVEKAIEELLK